MDYKNRMILFFILIAIIPIAALSAVFSFTVIKFREEMSVVYPGFVPNLDIVSKNKSELANIRSHLIQFTSVESGPQKSAQVSQMLELKSEIDGSLEEYTRIEDLPNAFDQPFGFIFPVDSFDISKLASNESLLAAEIDQQWSSYSSRIEDLSILASNPSFNTQANAEASQLTSLTGNLISSYDSLYAVNVQIGNALRERSLQTMQLAFLYGGLASAISAASATAAAILVSKRVVLGDLVRMTKLDLVETTLRDLIGGGADTLLAMVKSQISEEPAREVRDVATAVVPSNEDMIIGASKKDGCEPLGQAGTKAFVEDYEPLAAAGQELKGHLVMINYSMNSRPSPQATWTLGQLFETSKLILVTRRGSNLYHTAQGKSDVYVLGDPEKENKTGEQVIPAGDEALLAQAAEDLIKKNSSSTLLIDNATELIYTLGFDRTFALLHRLAEVVSTYEDSGIVVLINKKAHEQRIVEALSSVSNILID